MYVCVCRRYIITVSYVHFVYVYRLTALMERYCPSNRSGWNWELPKFIRKMKTPDYRERQVFGVPLQVVAQRTGQPLPPGIQAALQFLRATSLDQVRLRGQ